MLNLFVNIYYFHHIMYLATFLLNYLKTDVYADTHNYEVTKSVGCIEQHY